MNMPPLYILIPISIMIIVILLLYVSTKIILFYYILKIEEQHCNCMHDWRRDFLKYMLLINLILYTFGGLGIIIVFSETLYKILLFILITVECIIAYSYFTYIRDLKDTKCKCLINTNKYLYGMRWLVMIINILGILISFSISIILSKTHPLNQNIKTIKTIIQNII